jgi:hypothetical protein
MLDYKALDKEIDVVLKSFTKDDLSLWLKLKLERENLERLANGETVSVEPENYIVSQVVICIEDLEALIDVRAAGENNYALAA